MKALLQIESVTLPPSDNHKFLQEPLKKLSPKYQNIFLVADQRFKLFALKIKTIEIKIQKNSTSEFQQTT